MADMKPEDLEKLRRLEEEVDRERAEMQKRREELEKKALVPVDEAAAQTKNAPAVKEETSKAVATETDANSWKRSMQTKIAVGAGGVMVAYWLMTNIITIIAIGGVVGGAYYFSGKYLNPEPDQGKGGTSPDDKTPRPTKKPEEKQS